MYNSVVFSMFRVVQPSPPSVIYFLTSPNSLLKGGVGCLLSPLPLTAQCPAFWLLLLPLLPLRSPVVLELPSLPPQCWALYCTYIQCLLWWTRFIYLCMSIWTPPKHSTNTSRTTYPDLPVRASSQPISSISVNAIIIYSYSDWLPGSCACVFLFPWPLNPQFKSCHFCHCLWVCLLSSSSPPLQSSCLYFCRGL